jgi:hypothetical protein
LTDLPAATILSLPPSPQVDPDEYVNGVFLTDKHSRGTVSLRLEIWYATADDVSARREQVTRCRRR